MKNKERVMACIHHEETDHLPYDIFEGWMWPGITSKLMEHLQSKDYDDFLNKIGASCRWVTPMYNGPALPPNAKSRVASPHTMHSLNASIWGLVPGVRAHGRGEKNRPFAETESPEEVHDHKWPSPNWFDYDGLNERAKNYKDDFVIVGGFSPLFYLIADLCGMEKTLMDIIINPELISAFVEKILEFYKEYFGRICQKCKGNIDAIALGDDFASQKAMLMSPEHWRRFFKPAWEELFKIAKASGYITMFHSCGSVFKVIPDFIEMGLDILYPIQPKAKFMDIQNLKSNFGKSLTFYGGIDVQELMPLGTPMQIKEEVKNISRLFKNSGGYIISTSHVIMEDVPVENVLALYEEANGKFEA